MKLFFFFYPFLSVTVGSTLFLSGKWYRCTSSCVFQPLLISTVGCSHLGRSGEETDGGVMIRSGGKHKDIFDKRNKKTQSLVMVILGLNVQCSSYGPAG